MNKIIFSFGNWRYYRSLQALEQSIKVNGNVDQIIMLKESDIDPQFYIENARHFRDGRGFGYWVWKAYFITRFLDSAKDEDVFFYVDAGNEALGDLTPLYTLCQQDEKGVLLFENTDGEPTGNIWKNNLWTKSDCFNIMGLKEDKFLYGNQVNASYILFRKTDFSKQLFGTFFDLCKNYNLISDAPNITENFNKDFRDHRHDQSILSLLSILHQPTILRDPSQWGNHKISASSVYNQLFDHHRRKYYI